MIRSYQGTAEGKTLAVYRRQYQYIKKMVSNGYYCAYYFNGNYPFVYFSPIEAEIDEWIEQQIKNGFKKVG